MGQHSGVSQDDSEEEDQQLRRSLVVRAQMDQTTTGEQNSSLQLYSSHRGVLEVMLRCDSLSEEGQPRQSPGSEDQGPLAKQTQSSLDQLQREQKEVPEVNQTSPSIVTTTQRSADVMTRSTPWISRRPQGGRWSVAGHLITSFTS